jgi:hypothetical protein
MPLNTMVGWQGFSLLTIGLGIGWLAGLSVSATVSTIITSVLGLAAGLAVGMNASPRTKNTHLDARPAAILILGIALAAPAGIVVRTHHFLEPHRTEMAAKNNDSSALNKDTPNQARNFNNNQEKGVLFGVDQDECSQILSLGEMNNNKAFMRELRASHIPGASDMVDQFSNDTATLKSFVRIICQHYK